MKSIFFILFSGLTMQVFAQDTFDKILSDPVDQYSTSIIETDEFYLLSTYFDINYLEGAKTKLFKINKQGDVCLTKLIGNDSLMFLIENIFYNCEGSLTGIGSQKLATDSTADFTIIGMDNNFSIITEKQYGTCFKDISYTNILEFNDQYITVSAGMNTHNYLKRIFAYKLNSSFDTITSKVYPEEDFVYPFEIISSITGDYPIFFTYGLNQYTNTGGQIIYLDNMLERTDIKGIPERVSLYNDAKRFNDRHYLLTGKKHIYNSQPQDEQLAIMLMDCNDSVQKISLLGAVDTIDYPGIYTNLDFNDTNNIYYAGTKNFSVVSSFPQQFSWFFLNKLDSNLELQWQKFYGGDAYYSLTNMIATQDDGCLMAGTRYDYLTQVNERDIYLVKVDENGLITGTGEELSQIQVYDAIVYPNPGSSYMKVQSGPQIEGAVFDLYDMAGKAVAREILNNRIAEINTSALPVGTYTYRIGLNNRLVGSGKWVKR